MLLESVPLGNPTAHLAHSRVITAVLGRYLIEDPSFKNRTGPFEVPRFLLNDYARYWRTMAVDFAYKRRKRFGKGAALRVIKLRMSRKLLFASGLLGCFACHLKLVPGESSCSKNTNECIDCLAGFFSRTPLEIVSMYLLRFLETRSKEHKEKVRKVSSDILDTYNEFLALLREDKEARDHLNDLKPDAFATDSVFERGRKLSRTFNNGILSLFFELDDSLSELTKFYGVF